MPNSKDGYPHQIARFGLYPYQGSMTHRVYYLPTSSMPNHNFCHDVIDFSTAYPRSSTATNTSLTWVPPFILMVDRSPAENCNFVQMVRAVLSSSHLIDYGYYHHHITSRPHVVFCETCVRLLRTKSISSSSSSQPLLYTLFDTYIHGNDDRPVADRMASEQPLWSFWTTCASVHMRIAMPRRPSVHRTNLSWSMMDRRIAAMLVAVVPVILPFRQS
jgi:hypothetical protein